MRNSKLFDALRSFSKEEWKHFQAFLKGQTDEASEVTTLYTYIATYKSDLYSDNLRVEEASSFLFPEKTRKNYLNIMSRLLAHIRDYFLWSNINQNTSLKKVLLIEEYNRRGLYYQADKLAGEYDRLEDEVIDIKDPLYRLLAFHNQYFSDNPVKSGRESQLLSKCWDYLQSTYSDFFLFYFIEAYNTSQVRNNPEEYAFILEREEELQKLPSHENEVLTHLYELRRNGSDESYAYLYESLVQGSNWSESLKLIALIFCNSHIAREISQGDYTRANQIFELFRFGLKEGFFLYQGQLTQVRFLNMIDYATKLGYGDWAKDLILEWSGSLPEETRINDVLLAEAMIFFSHKKFDKVLTTLARLRQTKLQHRLRARWISIRTYYELYGDKIEFMTDQLNNYIDFFHRNESKLSNRNYDGSLALGTVIKKLMEGEDKTDILKDFVTNKNIVSAMWVKSKLNTE